MVESLVIGVRNGRKVAREKIRKNFLPCGRWELQRVVADNME